MQNRVERLLGETQVKLLALVRRDARTITELASSLRLTDNAVRLHVAALGKHGLLAEAGAKLDTGGKPARLYALTSEGEELFPKAYAFVLNGLVEEIAAKDGRERALELLRAVGQKAAAQAKVPSSDEGRVRAAAAVLRNLGGDIE